MEKSLSFYPLPENADNFEMYENHFCDRLKNKKKDKPNV